MDNFILDNYIECKCVYSKKLDELIPAFKLVPKDVETSVICGRKIYEVDHYVYPKTGERFDCATQIYDGLYDLVKKKVLPSQKIVAIDIWMVSKDLIGAKVIDPITNYQDGRKSVKTLTINKIIEPDINNDHIDCREVHFFTNKEELLNYITTNQKKIIKGEELKEGCLIKVIEPYIDCELSNGKITCLNYLTFLD